MYLLIEVKSNFGKKQIWVWAQQWRGILMIDMPPLHLKSLPQEPAENVILTIYISDPCHSKKRNDWNVLDFKDTVEPVMRDHSDKRHT